MALQLPEYLLIENPEILAILLGFLIFAISLHVLTRIIGNKGIAIISSLCIGSITGYALLQNRFYGNESIMVILLYLVIGVILIRIFWTFVRGTKHRLRK